MNYESQEIVKSHIKTMKKESERWIDFFQNHMSKIWVSLGSKIENKLGVHNLK